MKEKEKVIINLKGVSKYYHMGETVVKAVDGLDISINMVTHEPELAEAHANRVYWLRDGRLEKITYRKNGFKIEKQERALIKKHEKKPKKKRGK
jgi:ABC-type methionine transport system ATPase subunit